MMIAKLYLKNWRNFKKADVTLRDRVFVVGPNASGKSNLLDVFRFPRDIARSEGGGLQRAVKDRDPVAERSAEAVDRLRRQCDLGDEDDRRLA